jgi:hypothetical protein
MTSQDKMIIIDWLPRNLRRMRETRLLVRTHHEFKRLTTRIPALAIDNRFRDTHELDQSRPREVQPQSVKSGSQDEPDLIVEYFGTDVTVAAYGRYRLDIDFTLGRHFSPPTFR